MSTYTISVTYVVKVESADEGSAVMDAIELALEHAKDGRRPVVQIKEVKP